MSNAPDLKVLRKKREEILKAELAAWLHDWQKTIPYWKKIDSSTPIEPKKVADILNGISPTDPITGSTSLSLKVMIETGRDPSRAKKDPDWRVKLIGVSHDKAHMDKPEIAGLGPASKELSTPFGYEIIPQPSFDLLIQFVQCIQKDLLEKRAKCLENLEKAFQNAIADTRKPINEVTLWSWAISAASLWKAGSAMVVLTKNNSVFASWRLLSIRTDGLGYLLSANSIPDLLARKELLTDAWNRVQTLLEEEYPLGLEVYRDENGPVFVVPDIDNLLGLTDSDCNTKTLRELILEAFRQGTVKRDPCLALAGEIVPHFKLDKEAWDGQSKLPPIGKDHLKEIPPLQSDPQWVAEQWYNLPKSEEGCIVCGLRPQGPGKKARDRKMCDVCEKRRADRAREWAVNTGRGFLSTIWLDEVADRHGRIALLVGTFDLDFWLDGTLARSLAVRNPENVSDKTKTKDIAKNPSFARLRRIWETTRKFWEETLKETEQGLRKRPHIFLKGRVIPADPTDKEGLGPYHAYELEIQGRKVAVLWVPEDATDDEGKALEYRGGFWVIENLDYLDNVYGRSFQNLVQKLVGQPLKVYEPTEYGRPGQEQATFTMAQENSVQYLENTYLPLIPILAEPRTFMALVPAESAFKIVKAIKTKYEREMGKVRNRLPLHLGVVFAGRKMPLRAIMDAGRRMLRQQTKPLVWEAMCSARRQIDKGDELPEEFKDDKEGQFKEWYEVTLRNGNHQITWFVPALMGDGQTPDHWYPYVFLASPDEPTDRRRYYKTDLGNPWNPAHPWLVHAGELQPGDKIYLTPATVDFEFLDYNIRRFEIYYEDGKHKGTLTRPYLLDEFPVLEKIWRYLTEKQNDRPHLSSSQIFAIRNLIETKREEWFEKPEDSLTDENFKKFCKDLFFNAQWNWGKPDGSEGITYEKLADWAVRGWFTDAVYLFHHVMKESDDK